MSSKDMIISFKSEPHGVTEKESKNCMKMELVQHSGRLNYDASKILVNKIYYRFSS